MRSIICVLTVLLLSVSAVLASGSADFESFIQTREVLATLYFDTNAEDLSSAERNRLADTIQQLRNAQKNGRMIRVEGFSSTEGDQERNFVLSFFRARSVADLIEAEGLVSEVTLTGYGDLRAGSKDHAKERRVEIASYVKPVGMKRVKVADNKIAPEAFSNNSVQVKQDLLEIDSYRLDQAIRSKLDDKGGFAEQRDQLDDGLQPGLSQSRIQILKEELDRGYTMWRQSLNPDTAPKLSQSTEKDLNRGYSQLRQSAPETTPGLTQSQKAGEELKRGYSQLGKGSIPDSAPGVTMVAPVQAPVIDALMIEQAIMEKIGVEQTEPSGSVSQVDLNYR